MSGFLYFLDGVRTATAATVRVAGLADRMDDISQREAGTGPNGAGGLVIAAASPDDAQRSIGYYPDRQTWVALPDGPDGRLSLGWSSDEKPLPKDLARDEQIDGYLLDLGSAGNEWIIPIARRFPTGSELPASLALGPDGAVVRTVLPRFAAAWSDAERIWPAILAQHEPDRVEPADRRPIDDVEGFALAARILGINYRVGPWEVSALGLLTTQTLPAILGAFVDFPAYAADRLAQVDAAKKNDPPDGPMTGCSGAGGSPPDTTPPAATSPDSPTSSGTASTPPADATPGKPS